MKWVKSKRRREKKEKKKRLNDGNNNGQATHGACKHAWRTQIAWANLIMTRQLSLVFKKAQTQLNLKNLGSLGSGTFNTY